MAVNLFITPTVLLAFPDFVTSGTEHADVVVQEACLSEFGSVLSELVLTHTWQSCNNVSKLRCNFVLDNLQRESVRLIANSHLLSTDNTVTPRRTITKNVDQTI